MQGKFRLDGLLPQQYLITVTDGLRRCMPLPPTGQPCVLRPTDGRKFDEDPVTGHLVLHFRDMADRPLAGVRVHVNGQEITTDSDGTHAIDLWTGSQGVTLGDGLSPFEAEELAVTISAGGTIERDVRLRARPFVRFRVHGSNQTHVVLAAPTWSAEVTDLQDLPVPVPCNGDAAFWIGGPGDIWVRGRCQPLPRDFATRGEPIECVAPRAEVTGRLLDADGKATAGEVSCGNAVAAAAGDGTFRLLLVDQSNQLVCRPPDPAQPPRLVPLPDLLGTDDVCLPLGDIRLWHRSPLSFRTTDGATVADGEGRLVRGGREVGPFTLQDGAYVGPEPHAGDEVRFPWFSGVHEESWRLRRLEGAGPWLVDELSGCVTFTVVDDVGVPIDAYVWTAPCGQWLASSGTGTFRGMAAGVHRFTVAAHAHRSCIVQIDLRDGERREVHIVLPRIPQAQQPGDGSSNMGSHPDEATHRHATSWQSGAQLADCSRIVSSSSQR
jgi:hypothetical protein